LRGDFPENRKRYKEQKRSETSKTYQDIESINKLLPGDLSRIKYPISNEQKAQEIEHNKKKIKDPTRFFQKARGEEWKSTTINDFKSIEGNEIFEKEKVTEEFKDFWGEKVFKSRERKENELEEFLSPAKREKKY